MVNLEVQKLLKAANIKFQMPIPLKIEESGPPKQKTE
jgi:hypothetical protein